ncbi:MAG: hypothetical protein A2991_00625 [Candidatus Terrybacteria bacterium RIFCSPLOWO2_01_FULL_58_14]|uniref:DUF1648 domain-containing protein n=2 Tax=Candidatus Terryibacteriota TaxID=1817920 RepID=A0A1G2PXX1_9BACT|nr:MAG: hypothetical protein A2682_01195 [Candidatus Terrybacteria bacterium RIFCSPHIGHO2_01_FULL_58_15]OHA52619.1 MAG: hypothetical protein A2991_00625 [Candidatus Terrybacteria bacterium RIFCSPLOWO2_01_FULL_58_14]
MPGFDRNRTFSLLLVIAGVVHLFLWWGAFQFPAGTVPLVLHYRIGGGIDLLGGRTTLMTIPFSGLAILTLNIFLALLLRRRDKTLSILALATGFLAQLFLAIALVALFIANRS